MKNIWIYLTILTLCLFLSVDALDAVADNNLYVKGSRVNVRKGPGADFPVIMQLSSGTKVIERSRRGAWVAVKVLGAEQTGWIHATLLKNEKIEDPNGSASSTEDFVNQEASQAPTASIFSEANTNQELDKVGKSSEPVSERYLPEKFGVVDIQRIILESKQGKKAKKYAKSLISSSSEKDFVKTEQQLISQIIKDIEVVVEKYARKNGFYLIISKGDVIFFGEGIFDITDDIIRLYDELIEASSSNEKG